MNRNGQMLPQARTNDLVTRELPEEVLVYDLKTHKAHCLNHTAATVWKYCDGQTSAAALAQAVSQDMQADVNEQVIWLALDQLGKSNLLEEKIVKPESFTGLSRRQALRRIGITAIAVPIITSVIAPTVLASHSCVDNPCSTQGTQDQICDCSGCCAKASAGAFVLLTCRPSNTIAQNGFCTHNCQCVSNSCSANKCN